MNEIDVFANRVISILNKKITDAVFLEIQSDRDLMQEYLALVERNGVSAVNQTIGKSVKRQYQLADADDREKEPASTLIRSHQKFD